MVVVVDEGKSERPLECGAGARASAHAWVRGCVGSRRQCLFTGRCPWAGPAAHPSTLAWSWRKCCRASEGNRPTQCRNKKRQERAKINV